MLNIEDIKKIIPHRAPFLLVDRIDELEPGIRAVGRKCVTYNEPFFQGHFPDQPVMPGVLIIEALAQVGAVCALCVEGNEGKVAVLGRVNNAKFRRQVVPGDVLMMEIDMIKFKGSVGVGRAVAKVDGKVAASAEITFVAS